MGAVMALFCFSLSMTWDDVEIGRIILSLLDLVTWLIRPHDKSYCEVSEFIVSQPDVFQPRHGMNDDDINQGAYFGMDGSATRSMPDYPMNPGIALHLTRFFHLHRFTRNGKRINKTLWLITIEIYSGFSHG